MRLKIVAVLLLGTVGVGAGYVAIGGTTANTADAASFLTAAVSTGDVTDDVAASGAVAAEASYGLAFGSGAYLVTDSSSAPSDPATWLVTDVRVTIGSLVVKGDAVAVASTSDLSKSLASAERSVRSARVSLRAAEATLDDAEDADVTAQIRQAKIGVYDAETRLAQARDERASIKDQISAATLIAPIDGVVTEVNIRAGLDAPAGAAIVIRSTSLQVTTDVVESDLVDIEIGQDASVAISAIDAVVAGTVSAISPIAASDGGSGVVSYPVTVTLTAPPATARSGMSADVTITIGRATDVLTVPATALRGTSGDYSVLVLGPDGQPDPQAVEVGLITSTFAEIKSGVTEGQEVITGTNAAQAGTATTPVGGFGGGGFPGGGPGGGGPGGGGPGGGGGNQP